MLIFKLQTWCKTNIFATLFSSFLQILEPFPAIRSHITCHKPLIDVTTQCHVFRCCVTMTWPKTITVTAECKHRGDLPQSAGAATRDMTCSPVTALASQLRALVTSWSSWTSWSWSGSQLVVVVLWPPRAQLCSLLQLLPRAGAHWRHVAVTSRDIYTL